MHPFQRYLRIPPALLVLLAPASVLAESNPSAYTVRHFASQGSAATLGSSSSPEFNQNHYQYFINRARCECRQKIYVTVQLRSVTEDTGDRTNIYVGHDCSRGQTGNNDQYYPCVELDGGTPDSYIKQKTYHFDPIWLAWGTGGDVQSISQAEPAYGCDAPASGSAGLYMCSGTGDCQAGTFFLKAGDSSSSSDSDNTEQTEQSPTSSGSIQYDYTPPLSAPSLTYANAGNNSLELNWRVDGVSDIAGYRILCSTEDGEPVFDAAEKFGLSRFITEQQLTQPSEGTIYYTKESLCGDDVFWDDQPFGSAPPEGRFNNPPPVIVEESEEDFEDPDDTFAAGPTTGSTSEDNEFTFSDANDKTFDSMSWKFICSDHLDSSAASGRVSGLENGVRYKFSLVAYDRAGNAIKSSNVLNESPRDTNGFWEQCDDQPGTCGQSGFCSVSAPQASAGKTFAVFMFSLLTIGGIATRRRRHRC